MTADPNITSTATAIACHLQALIADRAIPDADTDTAQDLARRLTAPAKIVILTRAQDASTLADQIMSALRTPGLVPTCVPLPDDPAGKAVALSRLGETADIVLWCGGTFGPADASAWAHIPDRLKDHSLLAAPPDTSGDTLAAMQSTARHEFAGLVSIAPGPDFGELRSAVNALADAGRGALMDAADVLLLRAALPMAPAGSLAKPDENGKTAKICGKATTEDAPNSNEHCADLALYLAQRGAELMPLATKPRAVLDNCLAACEAVAESLNGASRGDTALACDVTDAADKMLLIAMEDGPAAAADAVAILLQLRREFECRADA